jgi:hypothetical protein
MVVAVLKNDYSTCRFPKRASLMQMLRQQTQKSSAKSWAVFLTALALMCKFLSFLVSKSGIPASHFRFLVLYRKQDAFYHICAREIKIRLIPKNHSQLKIEPHFFAAYKTSSHDRRAKISVNECKKEFLPFTEFLYIKN